MGVPSNLTLYPKVTSTAYLQIFLSLALKNVSAVTPGGRIPRIHLLARALGSWRLTCFCSLESASVGWPIAPDAWLWVEGVGVREMDRGVRVREVGVREMD